MLLNQFQPLVLLLQSLSKKLPHIFIPLGSSELKCKEESVIAVWTRESPHNYENNSKINEVKWMINYCIVYDTCV